MWEMEISCSIWMVLIVILGGLLAIFGITKNANEWFYVRILGKKRELLPPGDMGWPFIGTQLAFLKAFKSNNPDSFISNFAARFGPTELYRAVMFGKPCVIVTTPQSCKRVLSDDTTFGPGFPESITKLKGKKAFHGISKEEHKRLRRLTFLHHLHLFSSSNFYLFFTQGSSSPEKEQLDLCAVVDVRFTEDF